MSEYNRELVFTIDTLKSDLLCNHGVDDRIGYLVWKKLDIDSDVRNVIRTKSMILESLKEN